MTRLTQELLSPIASTAIPSVKSADNVMANPIKQGSGGREKNTRKKTERNGGLWVREEGNGSDSINHLRLCQRRIAVWSGGKRTVWGASYYREISPRPPQEEEKRFNPTRVKITFRFLRATRNNKNPGRFYRVFFIFKLLTILINFKKSPSVQIIIKFWIYESSTPLRLLQHTTHVAVAGMRSPCGFCNTPHSCCI